MITIGVFDLDPHGACSYYRGLGVLSKLRHLRSDVTVKYIEQATWFELSSIDICFFMRPTEDSFITALEMAKDFGVPIWVDLDDLIHDIPEDNPSHEYFTKTKALDNLLKGMSMADIVTVSTPALAEYYSQYCKKITVIENAFNDYNYSFTKYTDKTANFINWRGSITHEEDLLSRFDEIMSVSKAHPDWTWSFLGYNLRHLTKHLDNKFCAKQTDIISYNKIAAGFHPAIQMVPLVFRDFNRAKSNIAWIEGTLMGATVIAPDMPEFYRPGVVQYREEDDSFKYYLEKLIKSASYRKENYEKSFEYIHDNLMLSHVNSKRLVIMDYLL